MIPSASENSVQIDTNGWCDLAERLPSPNCDVRPEGLEISLMVVHNISLPAGKYGSTHVCDLFGNKLDYNADPSFEELRGIRVSAHFLVKRDGALIQFVPTTARAWHAGVSSFNGKDRCNDFSIGVELEGCDTDAFTDAQYQTLCRLTIALQHRHPLTDVAGHQHIAPGRKTDPGPFFDWPRYRAMLALSHSEVPTHGALRFAA